VKSGSRGFKTLVLKWKSKETFIVNLA